MKNRGRRGTVRNLGVFRSMETDCVLRANELCKMLLIGVIGGLGFLFMLFILLMML